MKAIVQCKHHIVLCGRTKADYDLGKGSDANKSRGQKIGTKMVTREGFDYEMTMAFKIHEDHYCEMDKDRTDLFAKRPTFIITEETGKEVKKWNDSGAISKEFSPLMKEIIGAMKTMTNNFQDKIALDSLVEKFGKSSEIATLNIAQQEGILESLKIIQHEWIENEQSAEVES